MRLLKFILNFFKRIFLKREEEEEEPRNHFVIQVEKKVHNEPNEPQEEEEEVRLMKFIAGAHGKGSSSSGTASLADLNGDTLQNGSSFVSSSAFLTFDTTGNLWWDVQIGTYSDVDIGSWFSPEGTPDLTWYIKLRYVSGQPFYVGGDTIGQWHSISSTQGRSFEFGSTTVGTLSGTYAIDLATDSGGTDIISTATFVVSLQYS